MGKDKDEDVLRIDADTLFGGKSIITRIKDKTATGKPSQDHSKNDKKVTKK